MRLLERCIADWPMPEVEAQIHGLREAFSANLSRPFELKPSFPYGSPSERGRSPEERRLSENPPQMPAGQNAQMYTNSYPQSAIYATPPISTRPLPDHSDQHLFRDYHGDENIPPYHHMPPTSNANNAATPTEPWNPTPIIDQFNTAFAIPQSALAPPPPSSYSSSPPVSMPQQKIHSQAQQQHYATPPMSMQSYQSHHTYHPSPTSQPMANPQNYMHQPTPQLTPSHYAQNRPVNSYFDTSMDQKIPHLTQQPQVSSAYDSMNGAYTTNAQYGDVNAPVYVTPKEWQRSVAGVFDAGSKRKRGYEPQLVMH